MTGKKDDWFIELIPGGAEGKSSLILTLPENSIALDEGGCMAIGLAIVAGNRAIQMLDSRSPEERAEARRRWEEEKSKKGSGLIQ